MLFDGPLPMTRHNYDAEVGDGLKSSVLAAAINYVVRTAPEAPPVIEKRRASQWGEEQDHPLAILLQRPNGFYSGRKLVQATVLDYMLSGNAYWVKIRNTIGDVVQLWWIPRLLMRPRWPDDGSVYISHYEYSVNGRQVPVPVRDVVHFRFGLDPNNHRLGLSPVASAMREIATDDQAANFTAALLRNMGIIGVVISPKEKGAAAAKEAVRETKDYIQANFTGDKRGSPLALGAPTDVQILQYNMQGYDVGPIRDIAEERVSSLTGIPAAVLGFGTGLQQTKVGATMQEMVKMAWRQGIMPLQDDLADEINRSLLPDFEANRRLDARMRFDTSKARSLEEDHNQKHERVREDYLASIIDRAEARQETGRIVRAEDKDVYYTESQAEQDNDATNDEIPAAVAARLTGARNGNGTNHDDDEE